MKTPDIDNLLSVTLRDSGEIALIDGEPKIVTVIKTGHAVHIGAYPRLGATLFGHRPRRQISKPDRPLDDPLVPVAEIKVGQEARSVETSKMKGWEDKYAIAGYWPRKT